MGIKMRIFIALSLFFLLLLVLPGFSLAIASPDSSDLVPFETIDQGEMSYYRYGDAKFAGADLIIKDRQTWAWFWTRQTAGIQPVPDLPEIKFSQEMVIVTLLGYQTSGGGAKIEVREVNRAEGRLQIIVSDNETPGPLDVITNPFHIVKLKRVPALSIVFEHQEP